MPDARTHDILTPWAPVGAKNVTCLMSWLTCMSQLSWSFTRSWSWDLLIDLICMQKENFPSDFASSCAHGTFTICRSYRNQKTHTYCKVSSSLSGCKDVDTFEFMKPPQTLWLQNYGCHNCHHHSLSDRAVNPFLYIHDMWQYLTHNTWHTESQIVDF